MTYASKQNMIDRHGEEALIELTDRASEPTGMINDTVLNQALADADDTINSYIAARYDMPLSAVPSILIRHACVIAFYALHRGRYTDEVRKEYEDTLKFMQGVSRGDIVLDAAGVQPSSAPAEARVEGPERIFNRDSLKVY